MSSSTQVQRRESDDAREESGDMSLSARGYVMCEWRKVLSLPDPTDPETIDEFAKSDLLDEGYETAHGHFDRLLGKKILERVGTQKVEYPNTRTTNKRGVYRVIADAYTLAEKMYANAEKVLPCHEDDCFGVSFVNTGDGEKPIECKDCYERFSVEDVRVVIDSNGQLYPDGGDDT